MKPGIVILLETVLLDHSRYPEEKFEFDMKPQEAASLSEYIEELKGADKQPA